VTPIEITYTAAAWCGQAKTPLSGRPRVPNVIRTGLAQAGVGFLLAKLCNEAGPWRVRDCPAALCLARV